MILDDQVAQRITGVLIGGRQEGKLSKVLKIREGLGIVVHIWDPAMLEAELGGSHSKPGPGENHMTPSQEQTKSKRTRGVSLVVVCLFGKCEALSSGWDCQ
jgi:hypothetical protein